jgi:hypothetical protein
VTRDGRAAYGEVFRMKLGFGARWTLACAAFFVFGCSSDVSDDATSDDEVIPASAPDQVGGCTMFPGADEWNRDVSQDPVDATWTANLQAMVGDIKIHPDFGNSPPDHYGIPLNVVPKAQPDVPIGYDGYANESDAGPFPLPDPSVARIEGGTPDDCSGDCHFLVVQARTCLLFEGYGCSYTDTWRCSNGAKWDLTQVSYGQRKMGWTSADAAGLPIAPGLLRVAEVRAGKVTHAIRFTAKCTQPHYVAPATHLAVPSDTCDPITSPPMGLRVRMKADYDVSSLSESAQVVATGMKTYGMIIADNGSDFFFQGEDDPGWTEQDVDPLRSIPASAFEVIVPPPLEP